LAIENIKNQLILALSILNLSFLAIYIASFLAALHDGFTGVRWSSKMMSAFNSRTVKLRQYPRNPGLKKKVSFNHGKIWHLKIKSGSLSPNLTFPGLKYGHIITYLWQDW
jgi:hypothetical protein